jgi:hypothetical protein
MKDQEHLPKEHCPNCDHDLDEPINDIWKDPNVKAALRDGRSADDIAVLRCPNCSRWNYYNQGSSYWCRFCKERWYCRAEGEERPECQYINLAEEGFTSLADTLTVTTDGYDNQTI